jgi:hypothetical protein
MNLMRFVFFLSLSAFQLWFWCSIAKFSADCAGIGFLLTPVPLNHPGLVTWNIFTHLVILSGILGIAAGVFRIRRRRRRRSYRVAHVEFLLQVKTALSTVVLVLVVITVELTLQWNGASDINDISSAAQLFPLLVSLYFFARMILAYFVGDPKYHQRRAPVSDRATSSSTAVSTGSTYESSDAPSSGGGDEGHEAEYGDVNETYHQPAAGYRLGNPGPPPFTSSGGMPPPPPPAFHPSA